MKCLACVGVSVQNSARAGMSSSAATANQRLPPVCLLPAVCCCCCAAPSPPPPPPPHSLFRSSPLLCTHFRACCLHYLAASSLFLIIAAALSDCPPSRPSRPLAAAAPLNGRPSQSLPPRAASHHDIRLALRRAPIASCTCRLARTYFTLRHAADCTYARTSVLVARPASALFCLPSPVISHHILGQYAISY